MTLVFIFQLICEIRLLISIENVCLLIGTTDKDKICILNCLMKKVDKTLIVDEFSFIK